MSINFDLKNIFTAITLILSMKAMTQTTQIVSQDGSAVIESPSCQLAINDWHVKSVGSRQSKLMDIFRQKGYRAVLLEHEVDQLASSDFFGFSLGLEREALSPDTWQMSAVLKELPKTTSENQEVSEPQFFSNQIKAERDPIYYKQWSKDLYKKLADLYMKLPNCRHSAENANLDETYYELGQCEDLLLKEKDELEHWRQQRNHKFKLGGGLAMLGVGALLMNPYLLAAAPLVIASKDINMAHFFGQGLAKQKLLDSMALFTSVMRCENAKQAKGECGRIESQLYLDIKHRKTERRIQRMVTRVGGFETFSAKLSQYLVSNQLCSRPEAGLNQNSLQRFLKNMRSSL